MNSRLTLYWLGLFASLAAQAADSPPTIPLPQQTGGTPVIDGKISAPEYAYTFTDAKTGIRVSWQADQQRIYVGLVSPASGWVALGLGIPL